MRPVRKKRLAFPSGQGTPLRDIRQMQRPGQAFSYSAFCVEHLVAQSVGIERALNTVQVFDALGHAMRRSRARGAYLQHAPMDLHVKGKDVTAQVGEHAAFDEDVPERTGVLGADFSLVGTGEAVDGMHRVMAEHQLMARIDMALAAKACPRRMDKDKKQISPPHPVGQAFLPARTVARMAEHLAKHRLAHLVVGRMIAGGVPYWNRLTVEPGHLPLQPVPPL